MSDKKISAEMWLSMAERNKTLMQIVAVDKVLIANQDDKIRQLEMEVQELTVALLLRDRERENNREIKIKEINEIARMWGR